MKATRQPLVRILPVKFTCRRRCGKAGENSTTWNSGIERLRVPGYELKLEGAYDEHLLQIF